MAVSKLTPQELPEADLADLTKPKSRGAGLADLVNAAQPRPASAPEQAAVEVPVEDRPVAATPSKTSDVSAAKVPARKPGRPRTRSKPTTAVYVSPGVKSRFEKYRHNVKSTNLHVVLEAISTKYQAGELAEIIEKSRYSTAPTHDLFPADPSAVRYLGGGSAQIAFSPTAEQEEVIDTIGSKLGFDTRSTWIAPVLNAFLPGRKDA
ncbi:MULTISPECIES: hypothetical protein [Mycobacterium ulcerans group]|uniref:hypothetical protein n=1 Tax=Mycobacterium ulcerans group TaxID=2993898 RepID=UPI001F47532A|nr:MULTISPECIES: hypothetical protein [Mycobacterium ulcerans group]UZK92643.1 hypothetical protein OIO89_00640 [Mycobacterium ulcerans]